MLTKTGEPDLQLFTILIDGIKIHILSRIPLS